MNSTKQGRGLLKWDFDGNYIMLFIMLIVHHVIMAPDASYFIILFRLNYDFPHQGESAATQWVNILFRKLMFY
jgi:hypothetical protein